MSKKIQLCIVIFLLLALLVGCVSKEPTIVGTWYSEQDKIHMTINQDGTFIVEDRTMEDSDLLSGTYRIQGDQFLFTPTHETEIANTFTLTDDTLVLKYKDYSSTFKRISK